MVIEMLRKTSIYVLANAPFIRENIVYHTASSKLMFVFFFSFWHLLRYRHKIPSAQYKVRTSLCHTKFESRNRHRVEKNGQQFLPFGITSRIYFLENKSLMVFRSILPGDSGDYTCIADDLYESSHTTRLEVQGETQAE